MSIDPLLLVLVILAVTFVYVKFAVYPDVDQYALEHQSSVSVVRNAGESAIYRSSATPTGRPLIDGLSISSGRSTQTRPGTLHDIWVVAIKKLLLQTARSSYGMEKFNQNDAEKIVSKLGPAFKRAQTGASSVCILSTNSAETLLTIFASILYDVPISIIHTDKESLANIEILLEAADPLAIVVSDERLLKDIALEKYTPHLRYILYTGLKPVDVCSDAKIYQWKTFVTDLPAEENTVPQQSSEFPIRVIYPSTALPTHANGNKALISQFTHQNIAAAVATNIKILPKSQQWTDKDTVLIFTSQFTVFSLVAQLSALISQSTLAYIEVELALPSAVLEQIQPTILINDNYSTLSLLNLRQDLTLKQEIHYAFNRAALSRGTLYKKPVINYFKSVNQIFSSTMIYPNQQEQIKGSPDVKAMDDQLTNGQANAIRALTGAHFVHALTSPTVASSIVQTNIWDYREDTLDRFKNKAVTCVNFGSVMSCIEARLVDSEQDSVDTYNYGQLQVRGFSCGSDSITWKDTGITGLFTHDGCFRLVYET